MPRALWVVRLGTLTAELSMAEGVAGTTLFALGNGQCMTMSKGAYVDVGEVGRGL